MNGEEKIKVKSRKNTQKYEKKIPAISLTYKKNERKCKIVLDFCVNIVYNGIYKQVIQQWLLIDVNYFFKVRTV